MEENNEEVKWKILHVDDCPEDIEAMSRAVAASGHSVEMQSITTLSEALQYVYKLEEDTSEFSDYWPDLIFLDLRLKGDTGLTLLTRIKSHPKLKAIPVLILSGSEQNSDLYTCCSLGATAYIKKPLKLAELKEVVAKALDFWLVVAYRPREWVPFIP